MSTKNNQEQNPYENLTKQKLNHEFDQNMINHTEDNRKSSTLLLGRQTLLKSRQPNMASNEDGINNMKQNNEQSASVNVLDNLKQLMRQRRALYT